jgi:hypothetical protein
MAFRGKVPLGSWRVVASLCFGGIMSMKKLEKFLSARRSRPGRQMNHRLRCGSIYRREKPVTPLTARHDEGSEIAAAEAKRAERHHNDDLQQQLTHDVLNRQTPRYYASVLEAPATSRYSPRSAALRRASTAWPPSAHAAGPRTPRGVARVFIRGVGLFVALRQSHHKHHSDIGRFRYILHSRRLEYPRSTFCRCRDKQGRK